MVAHEEFLNCGVPLIASCRISLQRACLDCGNAAATSKAMVADNAFASREAHGADRLQALTAMVRRDIPATPLSVPQNIRAYEDTHQWSIDGTPAAKIDMLKKELGLGAPVQAHKTHSAIRSWHSSAPVEGHYNRDFATSYTHVFSPARKEGASPRGSKSDWQQCPPKQRWPSLIGTGELSCLTPSVRTTCAAFVGIQESPAARQAILGKVVAIPERPPPHHGIPRALGGELLNRSQDGAKRGMSCTVRSEDGATWREERQSWRSLSAPKREGKDYPTGLHTPRSRHTPSCVQGRYMLSGPDAHMILRSGVELQGKDGPHGWLAQKPAKRGDPDADKVHTGAVSHRGWL